MKFIIYRQCTTGGDRYVVLGKATSKSFKTLNGAIRHCEKTNKKYEIDRSTL